MISRLIAWALVLSFCAGVWHYGKDWHSPWATPKSPVLSQLPLAGAGCSEKCK